jgi:hypothetical protein
MRIEMMSLKQAPVYQPPIYQAPTSVIVDTTGKALQTYGEEQRAETEALVKAIEKQTKTLDKEMIVNVAAPVVNVPETIVNVPAPIVNVEVKSDKPDESRDVVKAIRKLAREK